MCFYLPEDFCRRADGAASRCLRWRLSLMVELISKRRRAAVADMAGRGCVLRCVDR